MRSDDVREVARLIIAASQQEQQPATSGPSAWWRGSVIRLAQAVIAEHPADGDERDRAANALFDAAHAVSYDLKLAISRGEICGSWNLLARPLAKAVEGYRPHFDADKKLENAAMCELMKAVAPDSGPR